MNFWDRFYTKHLEVPDILLPDIRGLLRGNFMCTTRTVEMVRFQRFSLS